MRYLAALRVLVILTPCLLVSAAHAQTPTDVQGTVYSNGLFDPVTGATNFSPDDAGNPVLVGAYGYSKEVDQDGGVVFSSGYVFTPLETDFNNISISTTPLPWDLRLSRKTGFMKVSP